MNRTTQRLMFSSKTDQHATPRAFAVQCVARFGINFDVCADNQNKIVRDHFSEGALALNWNAPDRVCWMNPPYGRGIVAGWIRKAIITARRGTPIVCLLPARTDTAWWHDLVVPNATLIEFIRGRLHFNDSKSGAPFPSVLVVFSDL